MQLSNSINGLSVMINTGIFLMGQVNSALKNITVSIYLSLLINIWIYFMPEC